MTRRKTDKKICGYKPCERYNFICCCEDCDETNCPDRCDTGSEKCGCLETTVKTGERCVKVKIVEESDRETRGFPNSLLVENEDGAWAIYKRLIRVERSLIGESEESIQKELDI